MNFNSELYAGPGYASKATDVRSVSGAAVLCEGTPIAWLPKTLQCLILFTTKAEYIAMGDGL